MVAVSSVPPPSGIDELADALDAQRERNRPGRAARARPARRRAAGVHGRARRARAARPGRAPRGRAAARATGSGRRRDRAGERAGGRAMSRRKRPVRRSSPAPSRRRAARRAALPTPAPQRWRPSPRCRLPHRRLRRHGSASPSWPGRPTSESRSGSARWPSRSRSWWCCSGGDLAALERRARPRGGACGHAASSRQLRTCARTVSAETPSSRATSSPL